MEKQKSSSRGETRGEKGRGKHGEKVMGDMLR